MTVKYKNLSIKILMKIKCDETIETEEKNHVCIQRESP